MVTPPAPGISRKQQSARARESTKVAAGNSLAACSASLAADWIVNLNDGATPDEVAPQARWSAWWRCAAGLHAPYQALVSNRARGSGCPSCGRVLTHGKRIAALAMRAVAGDNLLAKHPEIAAELIEEGGPPASEVIPGSTYHRLWRCGICGNEWRTSPHARTFPRPGQPVQGCPQCWEVRRGEVLRAAARERAECGHSVANTHPHLVPEWSSTNIDGPESVTARSNRRVLWNFPCGHSATMRVAKRTDTDKEQGCPVCAGRAVAPDRNFKVLAPAALLAEWCPTNERAPETYTPRSNRKVWWVCATPGCGNRWLKSLATRMAGVGCAGCSLGGRSMVEIRILFELARFLPDVAPERVVVEVVGDHEHRLDGVLSREARVAFEYDGMLYHREKQDKDEERSKRLENAGWTVIYARELPLEMLTQHSFSVNGELAWRKPWRVAQEVLRRALALGLVAPTAGLTDYLAGDGPIARDEAENFIATKRRPFRRRRPTETSIAGAALSPTVKGRLNRSLSGAWVHR